jgi:hypothetical protein
MKVTPLILLAVMGILVGLSLASAEGVNETNQTKPHIDPEVIAALQNNTRIEVAVLLIDDSNISYGDLPQTVEARRAVYEKKREYFSQAEDKVLSTLNSSDFELTYKFASINAFTGFIKQSGLEKLKDNPSVLTIEGNKQLYLSGMININDPGEVKTPEKALINNIENQTLSYVDPEILKAFDNQTWVSVFVVPVDNSNITVQGTNEERRNLSNQRAEWFRLAEEIIISNLSSTNIQNVRKHIGSFDAEISRQGLDDLVNDKRIEKVILNYGGSPSIAIDQNQSIPENTSISRNLTEIKISDKAKPQSFFQKIINFFRSLFRWK